MPGIIKYIWRLFASDSTKFVLVLRVAVLSPPVLLKLAEQLGWLGPAQDWLSWTNVIFGTAAILIVMLFWRAISHGYRIEQAAIPQVKFLFIPDEGSIVVTPQRMVDQFGKGLDQWPAKFVRGIIEGQSSTTIQDCRVHLESVEKLGPDGSLESTDYTEALPLYWSNTDHRESNRIADGTRYYFDILSISERHPKPVIAGNQPLRLTGLFDEQGTYRIGLSITTESSSKNAKIDVTWGPDWTNISGKEVK